MDTPRRRAAGCHTCRTRKVKCDMKLPVCQRCARAGRTCITDSAKQTLIIHSENNFVTGDTKRPRGPRSNYAKHSVELNHFALAYLLQHHFHVTTSADEPNLGGEWSECVSRYLLSGRSHIMVDLAFSALSLAVHAKIHRSCAVAKLSGSKYTKLLEIMRTTIGSSSIQDSTSCAGIDAVLLTIFLMSCYENTVSGMRMDALQLVPESRLIWSHLDGALAVLKTWYFCARNTAATKTELAACIIKMTRRGIIRTHIIRQNALPGWLLEGEAFGEKDSLDLAYDKLVTRLAGFRNAVIDLENQAAEVSTSRVEELHRESLALRRGLARWHDDALSAAGKAQGYQKATMVGDGPWPRQHFYSSTVYVYDSLLDAAKWLNYFALSVLLFDTSIKVLRLLQPDFNWKRELLMRYSDISNHYDGLAATIPFCLERAIRFQRPLSPTSAASSETVSLAAEADFRAVENKQPMRLYLSGLVVWPLTIASSLMHCLDDNLRRWAKQELAEIGRLIADGCLETVAEAP